MNFGAIPPQAIVQPKWLKTRSHKVTLTGIKSCLPELRNLASYASPADIETWPGSGSAECAAYRFPAGRGKVLSPPSRNRRGPVEAELPAEPSPEAFSEGEFVERSPEQASVPPAAEMNARFAEERAAEEREDRRGDRDDHYGQPDTLPSLEQIRAPFEGLSDYGSERPNRYRVYVGVAIAVILGLLVYTAWRNNTAFWSSGSAPSSLPQAVPSPAEPEPSAPAPAPAAAKPATPPTAAPRNEKPPLAGSSQNPPPRTTNREATPRQEVSRKISDRPANAAASRELTAATKPTTPPNGQSGAEELAVAQRYLNAGSGSSRDSREGANWLWKAVAKQNLTATLLLSDLYLRGDGVSKSCDQARLLLDAAARKGATAAAERLRNLRAFGCH